MLIRMLVSWSYLGNLLNVRDIASQRDRITEFLAQHNQRLYGQNLSSATTTAGTSTGGIAATMTQKLRDLYKSHGATGSTGAVVSKFVEEQNHVRRQ